MRRPAPSLRSLLPALALFAVATLAACFQRPIHYEDISRRASEQARAANQVAPTWRVQETYFPGSQQLLERRAGYAYADGRFERHGLQQSWYSDGTLRWEKRYDHGVKQGISQAWTPDGSPEYERDYAHGEPAGIWRTWFEGGALRSEVDFGPGSESLGEGEAEQELERRARWWYDDGQLSSAGPVRRGVRHGVWVFWSQSGAISGRGEWVAGERYGVWTFFHPDGSLAEQGRFRSNARVGEWQRWEPGECWPESDPGSEPLRD